MMCHGVAVPVAGEPRCALRTLCLRSLLSKPELKCPCGHGSSEFWTVFVDAGVALLPFVDERRLRSALEAVYPDLTAEESEYTAPPNPHTTARLPMVEQNRFRFAVKIPGYRSASGKTALDVLNAYLFRKWMFTMRDDFVSA